MFDLAIAIIERGIEKGDTTTIKRQALQLGYLCCVKLKDVQKEKEFKHRMSEMSVEYPITDHIVNQVGIRCCVMEGLEIHFL